MALTKRLRYEILRRDDNTCRYCGASAPDVKLTIDHVIPVSLGGHDVASNLVAACRDCNAGKSSASPDSALVADVSASATTYMLALRDGFTRLRATYEVEDEYIEEFRDAWKRWGYEDAAKDHHAFPLPDGWTLSIRRWYRIGAPISLIEEAIEIAMTRRNLATAELSARFAYTAGVIWKRIDEIGSIETVTLDSVAVYTAMEADEMASDRGAAGYQAGYHRALEVNGIEE